nr:putative iron(III) ABC transporter, solute-binding protein [uncultured archaeon]CBH39499.1 putative iron(III) ABC transporter, solute-binding protein [uncultured archaeon]
MKTKIVMLVGITICTMLLVSPALASDADTLEIYGNANEDDTIDMRDLTYVKLIFFGKKPETELADAKYDGKINPLDFIQIKLIIVGKENELTVVDAADRIVTVSMPVERIVPQPTSSYEPTWVLAPGKVVGVTATAQKEDGYSWLPGILDKPPVGTYKELDYEKIMEIEPDIVIASKRAAEEIAEKLEPAGITVIALQFVELEKFNPQLKILAKILGKEEKAEEFISWRQNHLDPVKEKTEGIEPKVRVYAEYSDTLWGTGGKGSGIQSVITVAGGYNIVGDAVGYFGYVDPEWVILENPEVIFFPAWTEFGPTALTGYFMDSSENAEQFIEEACNRTGLKETDAVKKWQSLCN